MQVNGGENRTNSIAAVLSRMADALGRTKNSRLEALETRAEELRTEQKEAALKYNAELKERTEGKQSGEPPETLAEAAWGKSAWNESGYRERIIRLYSKHLEIGPAGGGGGIRVRRNRTDAQGIQP